MEDERGMKKDMEIFQRYDSKMNGVSELLKIKERVQTEGGMDDVFSVQLGPLYIEPSYVTRSEFS